MSPERSSPSPSPEAIALAARALDALLADPKVSAGSLSRFCLFPEEVLRAVPGVGPALLGLWERARSRKAKRQVLNLWSILGEDIAPEALPFLLATLEDKTDLVLQSIAADVLRGYPAAVERVAPRLLYWFRQSWSGKARKGAAALGFASERAIVTLLPRLSRESRSCILEEFARVFEARFPQPTHLSCPYFYEHPATVAWITRQARLSGESEGTAWMEPLLRLDAPHARALTLRWIGESPQDVERILAVLDGAGRSSWTHAEVAGLLADSRADVRQVGVRLSGRLCPGTGSRTAAPMDALDEPSTRTFGTPRR